MYLKIKYTVFIALNIACVLFAQGQANKIPLDAREQKIRQRYQTILLENPFQTQAFERLFESYSKNEGLESWQKQLAEKSSIQEHLQASLILRGLIHARQSQNPQAVEAFEAALELGATDGKLDKILGLLYYEQAQDAKAIPRLQSALDYIGNTEERAEICSSLGNIFLRNNQPEQAIATWERMVENNSHDLFAQLDLAKIYEENQFWAKAIDTYKAVLQLTPNDVNRRCQALRSIGQCHNQMQAYDQAIATFKTALQLIDPGNWLFEDIKLKLIQAYEDLGDLAGLIDYLQARLAQSPNAIDMRQVLAETYIRTDQFSAAESELNYIIERNPRDKTTLEKLIALHQKTEAHGKLVQIFESLIDAYPHQSEYIQRLGQHYIAQDERRLALETWNRHLERNEPTAHHYYELARWLESYQFYPEAITAYRKSMELEALPETAIQLANLLHKQEQPDKAIQLWLSSLGEDSSSSEIAEIAGILYQHKAYDQAVTLWKRAIELEPKNLEYRLELATVYSTQEKYAFGLPIYDYFLSHAPENNPYYKIVERRQLTTLESLGLFQKQFRKYTQAYEADPQSIKNIQAYARFIHYLGDYKKLVLLLEELVALEPKNTQFLEQLAHAYTQNKQLDNAAALLEELILLDPTREKIYLQNLFTLSYKSKDKTIFNAQRMVKASPANPDLHITLAQAYQDSKQTEQALEQYDQAIRLAPKEARYYVKYGDLLLTVKQKNKGEVVLRKALGLANEKEIRERILLLLISLYRSENNVQALLSEFKAVIHKTPKRLQAYEDVVVIYKALKDNPKIVETYELALEHIGRNQKILTYLIQQNHKTGNYEDAIHYYKQLIILNPELEVEKYVEFGKLYMLSGNLKKAQAIWAKIFKEHANDFEANQNLALVFQKHQLVDQALEAKAYTVEIEPRNYKNRYAYAYMLANFGQKQAAIIQLKKLLSDEVAIKLQEYELKKEQGLALKEMQPDLPSINLTLWEFKNNNTWDAPTDWQGDYTTFRFQIIKFMLYLAKKSDGEIDLIQAFENQIETHPEELNTQRNLVELYNLRRQFNKAGPLIDTLLKRNAFDSVSILNQAQYWIKAGHYKAAAKLLRFMKEKETLQNIAYEIFIRPNETEIFDKLKFLFGKFPIPSQVLMQNANAYWQKAQHWKAATLYEYYLHQETLETNIEPGIQLAKYYRGIEEHEKSVSLQKKIFEINPKYFGPISLKTTKSFEAAGQLHHLNKILLKIAENSTAPELHLIAYQFDYQKMFENAEELYKRANVLQSQEKIQRSELTLRTLLESLSTLNDPRKSYDLYLELFDLYRKRSNSKPAREIIENIVKLADQLNELEALINENKAYLQNNPNNFETQQLLKQCYQLKPQEKAVRSK